MYSSVTEPDVSRCDSFQPTSSNLPPVEPARSSSFCATSGRISSTLRSKNRTCREKARFTRAGKALGIAPSATELRARKASLHLGHQLRKRPGGNCRLLQADEIAPHGEGRARSDGTLQELPC